MVVDCRMKRVTLRTTSGEQVTFIGERSNHLSNVISTATARTMVRKGCEAYLVYVIDTKKRRSLVYQTSLQLMTIHMCFRRSCQDCLYRTVETAIDIVPGATPACITLYCNDPYQIIQG